MAFIRRPTADAKRIEARVAKYVTEVALPPLDEGVVPLAPGFFQLERMRLARAANKKQLRG